MTDSSTTTEQFCIDESIEGIDPDSVHKIRLPGGAMMPAAAVLFGNSYGALLDILTPQTTRSSIVS